MSPELLIYSGKDTGSRIPRGETGSSYGLVFVRLGREEALGLVESIVRQLLNESPNVGRAEYFAGSNVKGSWLFTVAVIPEQEGTE